MSNTEKKDKLSDQKRSGFFSIVYVYVIVIGLMIGLIYQYNITDMEKQTVPPSLPDSASAQTDLPLKEAKVIPPVDINEISKPTDELISKGKELFETTCVSCHGADGKGDGPAAGALNPPPRNFTSKENWVNGPTLSGIFQTISEGISGSAMIAYDNFTPEQRFELAHYIRTQFVPDPPKVNKDDLTALDQRFNLSKGTHLPAQIPVEWAMKILIQEGKPRVERVNNALKKIESEKENNAIKIFNRVTTNKLEALTSLTGSDNWSGSEERFVNVIVNNVNQNGFNEKVFYLSKNEWNELYGYLNSIL